MQCNMRKVSNFPGECWHYIMNIWRKMDKITPVSGHSNHKPVAWVICNPQIFYTFAIHFSQWTKRKLILASRICSIWLFSVIFIAFCNKSPFVGNKQINGHYHYHKHTVISRVAIINRTVVRQKQKKMWYISRYEEQETV